MKFKTAFSSTMNKLNNVWTFPVIMTILLLILAALSISGSSIGQYQKIFYGAVRDENLILNEPQPIRSDEWVVNAQKYIAQSNNDYQTINNNVGSGENEAVVSDNPTRDWSAIFKPQNFGFFVLPFDTAFSLKWWFMPYLLIIATYLTVLVFLPKHYLLASIISLGFAFSPFLSWWYTNGTFSTISFALLGFVVLTKLFQSRHLSQSILLSVLLAYTGICFALVLYPPFQIPVALVVFFVLIGYTINFLKEGGKILDLKLKATLVVCVGLIALTTIGAFLYSHRETVSAVQQSAYPGARIVQSGGYSKEHILSSHLSALFQDEVRASGYSRPDINAVNQSESSNFILLIPFLLIPLIYLAYIKFKLKKQVDYVVIGLLSIGGLFAAWLFIPGIDLIGKLTLLDKVPHPRLIIGVGVLNLFLLIYFVKLYQDTKFRLKMSHAVIYSLLVLILLLILDFRILLRFPEFIGFKSAVVYAIPLALITFLLLRKHFTLGLILYTLFALFSIYQINPLYKGTEILTQSPISQAMREIGGESDKKWITEDISILNFPSMNGLPSLAGTYLHPQVNLWNQLGQTDKNVAYNRYAHINFTFDRNAASEIIPQLSNPGEDQMNIRIEACDPFFKNQNVGFVVSSRQFESGEAPCLRLIRSVTYPNVTFYIYSL